MALVSEDAAKDAGPEVKSASGPSLAALLYPGLQALDEQYLGVDFAFGGPDQVIFHFSFYGYFYLFKSSNHLILLTFFCSFG